MACSMMSLFNLSFSVSDSFTWMCFSEGIFHFLFICTRNRHEMGE